MIAQINGRRAGLITYKAAEEALENVPAHIFTGHFGALRGKDGWKNSAVLAIAGRPLPRSEDVEALAAALFYDQDECVPLAGAQIGKAEAWYFMADGSVRPGLRERHPNATVELVRSQITEAELIQAIGRARAVRRGAGTPVLVLILTNVPLPLAIDELVAWSDLKPSKLDLAFARLGVRGLAAARLAKLCPDLFPTEAIAKHEVKGGGGNVLVERYILESCPNLTPCTYQLAGSGQRPRTAEFDLDRIPDPAEWLTDNIGPIKGCQPAKDNARDMGQPTPVAPLPKPSAVPQAPQVVGHGKLPPLLRLPPTEQVRVVRALDGLSTATCPPEHFDPLKLIDFGVDAGLIKPEDRRHLRKRMRDLGKGYFGREMQKREFAKPHLYPVLALAELAMRKRGYTPAIERITANA